MKTMPKLRDYIKRLQYWRDLYERALDARTPVQQLDMQTCTLTDFHHTRFEDVEIPGQYVHVSSETKRSWADTQHIDQNEELVKIARFVPKAELGRGHGHCFRRLTMVGSNGTNYTFNVQLPAARHCRREERLTQLFRIMNRSVILPQTISDPQCFEEKKGIPAPQSSVPSTHSHSTGSPAPSGAERFLICQSARHFGRFWKLPRHDTGGCGDVVSRSRKAVAGSIYIAGEYRMPE